MKVTASIFCISELYLIFMYFAHKDETSQRASPYLFKNEMGGNSYCIVTELF